MLLIPISGFGATLTTLPPNNGAGGIYLNLTANQSLAVTSFGLYFSTNSGVSVPIEVYTRPGSYVGFQSNVAGWTLTQTITVVSVGNDQALVNVPLSSLLNIGAGQTLGIYLQGLVMDSIRYQGLTSGGPATTAFSNADISMFTSHARSISSEAFGGILLTPRGFAGNVNYQLSSAPVPEPSTMVLFGAGLLGAVVLRQRNTTK